MNDDEHVLTMHVNYDSAHLSAEKQQSENMNHGIIDLRKNPCNFENPMSRLAEMNVIDEDDLESEKVTGTRVEASRSQPKLGMVPSTQMLS